MTAAPVPDDRGLSAEKRALLARRLRASSDAPQTLAGDPIAIIGLGCRFPGGANTPEAFWRLLHAGADAITRVPAGRWDAPALYDPDPQAPGKMVVQWGGFLDDVFGFDAEFFDLAPREAERMDPQQRLFLEVAWDALEHAGLTRAQLAGSAAGVFVGVSTNDYQHLRLGDRRSITAYDGSGTAHSIVANRLSYLLNLQGPSVAVDTACSSSLVAVHLACQSLRLGECELAVAGGVNVILTPEPLIALSKAQMLAPDGRCKTFDARANGYVRGEGCGVVVLKRLADALAANDTVLAVIRGSAVNQDGRTTGLTAPNGMAQQAVMRAALRNAGLAPAHISFIETHGTGTSLGDPIEVEALATIYGAAPRPIYLGAVKTNLGHLEAAAGMAGLIKVVLALRHGAVPPNLHFQALNPNITLAGTPFVLPAAPMPWATAGPRRAAALSSFGFGGTNAHLILEDAPALPDPAPEAAAVPAFVLPVSAHQPAALRALAARYAEHLPHATASLDAIAATAALRRTHHAYRFAAVGATPEDLAAGLAEFAQTTEALPAIGAGRLAWVFTGQGADDCRLPTELLDAAPAFREALAACDQALAPRLRWSVTEYVLGRLPALAWRDTAVAQPVTFAVQVALAAQWRAWGVEPEAVTGHSVGEIAAAHVAGVLSLADAAWLVAERGRLMQALHGQGRAASAQATPDEAEAVAKRYAGRVYVGAINSPMSVIFSGEATALAEVAAEWQAAGRFFRYLPVDYAFHSPAMQPVADDLARLAARVSPQPAALPLVSTVTGQFCAGPELDAGHWGRNVAAPVRFGQAVETLLETGHDIFLELGPHPLLQRPIQQCAAGRGAAASLAASLRQGQPPALTLLQALAALYRAGVPLDWARLYPRRQRPAALPAYPWQHTQFVAPPFAPRPPALEPDQHPFLGRRRHSPLGAAVVFEAPLDPQAVPLLLEHRLHDVAVAPAVILLDLALSAAVRAWGLVLPVALQDVLIQSALVVEPGVERLLQTILEPEGADAARFHIYTGVVTGDDVTWTEHARGLVRWNLGQPTAPPVDLPAMRAALPQAVAPAALYAGFRARGLAHGPAYQHLTELRVGAGEALGRVASSPWSPAAACQLPPPLFESCLQVVAAPLLAQAAPEAGSLYVPLALDRLVLYQRPGAQIWSHATLRAPAPANGAATETYTASVSLLAESGEPVAQLDGLRLKRVTAAAVRRLSAHPAEAEAPIYRLDWQPAPVPAVPPAAPAGRWLLFADSTGLADALAARLTGLGRSCVRVRPGAGFSHPAPDEFTLDPARPDGYARLWQEAVGAPDACAAVLYLWPSEGAPTSALYAAQMVARHAAPGTRLWLVAREADAPDGLWGLGAAFALEHAAHWGGLVRLAAGLTPEAAASDVFQSILAGDEDLVSLRVEGRRAARLQPLALPAPAAALAFRPDRSYLVTGGLGAVGQALVLWLAEHGARHIVVVSRRPAAGPEAEALRAALPAPVALRAFSADVADREALAGVLRALESAGPSLAGVFHLAGVLDDGLLLQQTAERFDRVWAPKAQAAWHLHTLTAHLPLDHFVLFSSAAGVLGAAGQANYAAANAALDALAQQRRAHGLPALSVDWGVWAEAGMAARLAPADQARLAAFGLEPLAPDRALALLGRLLAQPEPQAMVFPVDWGRFAQALPGWRGRSLLREVLPAPAPGEADAAAARAERERLLALPQPERAAELQRLLEAQVVRVLGMPASRRLDPKRGFFQLGLDSLMALELQQRVQAMLGVSLPATAVFDYPSLETMAAYLDGLLQPAGAVAAAEPPADPALAAAMTEVRRLSDSELDALLTADED